MYRTILNVYLFGFSKDFNEFFFVIRLDKINTNRILQVKIKKKVTKNEIKGFRLFKFF